MADQGLELGLMSVIPEYLASLPLWLTEYKETGHDPYLSSTGEKMG